MNLLKALGWALAIVVILMVLFVITAAVLRYKLAVGWSHG